MRMKGRNYVVYDVFTDTVLTGNPLAVVLDTGGLDTAAMQRIAGEFNLSETVFVLPADNKTHRAKIRIFTPGNELPFAGHPTVGTAIALAQQAAGPNLTTESGIFVLEENVGPVRCAVSNGKRAAFAEFDLPRLAKPVAFPALPEAVAAALGLDAHEIGFENHRIGAWSAGVPYATVPVRGLNEAAKARMNTELWLSLAPVIGGITVSPYIYCRDTVNHVSTFHARMFAPYDGIIEDPATGSAVAALTGAIMHFDQPVEGPSQFWIEQGIEMGRPSSIRLEIDVAGGTLTAARIGGHAVKVAEGTLFA
jgi:trans-2,3-dihydro-3-hydroxyanthranilate isomerase